MTDWLPELADDDLETLFEALEAWESKDVAVDLTIHLLRSRVASSNPVARLEMDRQRSSEKLERAQAKRLRKERSVLLRATLLTIRDRRHAENMTREVLYR